MLLLLSGCGVNGPDTVVIPGQVDGIWNMIVYIFSEGIILLGGIGFDNLIIGLILMTLIVRVAMIPLYKRQIKSQAEMAKVQPEMKAIQNKYKDRKDQESKIKQNQEIQALYARHGVNPLAGCLPLLLQMPLLFAFYDAIQNLLLYGDNTLDAYGVADYSTTLFGFDFSHPLIWVAALAAISTYYSTHVATLGAPKPDPAAGPDIMKTMKIVMPVMIFVMGLALPGALSIYWLTGNLVTIAQTLVIKRDTIFANKEKNNFMK